MSMNAIAGSSPVSGKYGKILSNNILNYIKDYFNNEVRACVLGSTGKKLDTDYSGDIDIAIELEFTEENIKTVKEFIDLYFYNAPVNVLKGLKIISFGNTYVDENLHDKVAQVDIMFSNNIDYSKFMYHSPNYAKNESNYKGLYRTNLLTYIAGRVPLENVYYSDVYDAEGNLTDYWKYTLTYDRGLVLTHKTYKGKKGLLKNPVTVKEDTKPVTTDINEIIKIILGDNATVNTTNSFESLMSFILTDKSYKYINNKLVIYNIISDFVNDKRHNDRMADILDFICNRLINKDLKESVLYMLSDMFNKN